MSCGLPTELKPKGVVVNMIPGLPAYLLFMCIRHADYLNDEAKLKSLMNAVIGAVKKVILVRRNLKIIGIVLESIVRNCNMTSDFRVTRKILSCCRSGSQTRISCSTV